MILVNLDRARLISFSRSQGDFLLLFLGCIFFTLLFFPPSRGDSYFYLRGPAILYLALMSFILFNGRKSERAFLNPLVFFIIWWILVRDFLPKINIFLNGLERHAALPGATIIEIDQIVAISTLYSVLSLAMIATGFYFIRFKAPRLPSLMTPDRLYIGLFILFLISSTSFLQLLAAAGSIDSLLMQRGLVVNERIQAKIGAHWHVAITFLEVGCYIAVACQPSIFKKTVFWIFFFFALIFGFSSTGSRSGVILQAIITLVIYSAASRKVTYKMIFIGGLLSVLALGGLGQIRSQLHGINHIDEVVIDGSVIKAFSEGISTLSKYSGEVYGLYGIVGKVPGEVPYLYGESYLSILFLPFPSSIVGDKPLSGGRLTSRDIFNNPLSGVPPTYIGEAFWNFGVIGVILVSLIWGTIIRFVFDAYTKSHSSLVYIVPYVLFLFYAKPDSNCIYGLVQSLMVFLISFYIMKRVSFYYSVRDRV